VYLGRGCLAGEPSNSPPNMTPLFNEIGTIAGERISPKRLVIFGNNLHYVRAGPHGYNICHTTLGTDRGYGGGKGEICRIFDVFPKFDVP